MGSEAPTALRLAMQSDSANSFCELIHDRGIMDTFEDFGDLHGTDATSHESIDKAVRIILDKGLAPLVFGGDHAVSFPVIRALRNWRAEEHAQRGMDGRCPPISILHFDAHPDLYDEFEGNRLSHACPFARISELNDEDAGSGAAVGGSINILQLGIRCHTAHSREQARRFGVSVVEARDWPETRADLARVLAEKLPPRGGAAAAAAVCGGGGGGSAPRHDVYVSFDMDVLDPAFAPGVSHHEPGGISTRQALDVLQALHGGGRFRVIGADVVELNPARDRGGVTAMAAAKVVKELLGLISLTR